MNTELSANHGALGSKKDKLVDDLKVVVADADDLLREVANSTTEEFVAARARIEAKLGETIASLRVAKIQATRKVSCAADASCDYVRENPWKIIGVAAASLVAAVIVSRCSSKCSSR